MAGVKDIIKIEFPLHYLIWNNDFVELGEEIKTNEHDLEKLDPRGHSPLMLAIKLCHLECVSALLAVKCNANTMTDGWSAVQEAVCTADPDILTKILEVRDLQRHVQRVNHVPQLLKKLQDAPDFYVEMKWEFTSWVPLMSTICPSDIYKVYKRGSNVRIDTTLLGFNATSWQRGNRSYIFKSDNNNVTMIEIDHDDKEVSIIEKLQNTLPDITGIPPTKESVNSRINAPVTSNHVDIDKISFERNKSGIWGWRSEKSENVNGYDCKVYAASNVEFITRTRTEHLNESQVRARNSRTPLQSFFGIAEDEFCKTADLLSPGENNCLIPTTPESENCEGSSSSSSEVCEKSVTFEEYFSDVDLKGRDVGRTKKTAIKVQKFKANLWLSEEFPIKLQEQVLPILDLMSTMASPHVSKLKEFITMQLPSGFPIKIEIPLFHVLNAMVTFSNVFAIDTPIENVAQLSEDNRTTCVIDDRCFDIPANYVRKGANYRRQMTFEDEDDLLQLAMAQSLLESGSENDEVDIWEALNAQRPLTPSPFGDEDAALQRALHESLIGFSSSQIPPSLIEEEAVVPIIDSDLAMALRLSEEEEKKRHQERILSAKEEATLLEEVLRLSLEEK